MAEPNSDQRTTKPVADPEEKVDHHIAQEDLIETVAAKETRKIRARRTPDRSLWFGLGTFGMIGWSVTAPIVLCVALGIWIDQRWPSRFSWTLMLLFVGAVLGCLNAWYWVTRQRLLIEPEEEDRDDS